MKRRHPQIERRTIQPCAIFDADVRVHLNTEQFSSAPESTPMKWGTLLKARTPGQEQFPECKGPVPKRFSGSLPCGASLRHNFFNLLCCRGKTKLIADTYPQ